MYPLHDHTTETEGRNNAHTAHLAISTDIITCFCCLRKGHSNFTRSRSHIHAERKQFQFPQENVVVYLATTASAPPA
jgi:hypothetical protein